MSCLSDKRSQFMAKTFNFNSHLLLLHTTFMKFINKNDPHLTLPYMKMIPQQNGRAPLIGYKQTQPPCEKINLFLSILNF